MIDEKKLIVEMQEKKDELKAERPFNDDFCRGFAFAMEFVKVQPKVGEWIPVSDRLPDEHDSMFAEFKGTSKWTKGMFEKISDNVNVTVKFENDKLAGKKSTTTSHTVDGRWACEKEYGVRMKVIAWQPLPEPYEGE